MLEKIKKGKIARFLPEIKAAIFERDGNKCLLCGSRIMLDPHHILFGTEVIYNEDRNTIKNGATLCRICHEGVHGCRRGVGDRQKVIDIVNSYYN